MMGWDQILLLGALGIAVAGEAAWVGARRARRRIWLGTAGEVAHRNGEGRRGADHRGRNKRWDS